MRVPPGSTCYEAQAIKICHSGSKASDRFSDWRLYKTPKARATTQGVILDKKAASHRSIIQRAINEIASDNTSGAAEILRRASEIFYSLASSDIEPDRSGDQSARQLVIKTCVALVKA